MPYQRDHTTGADGVHHCHTHHTHHAPHALKIRVFASPQEDLVPHEVGAVVHHKAPAVDPAGVAAVQVHVDVGAVTAALIGTALEVPLLEENDLRQEHRRQWGVTATMETENGFSFVAIYFICKLCVNFLQFLQFPTKAPHFTNM